LTITGDDYGLRGEFSQSSIVIVARNRQPIRINAGAQESVSPATPRATQSQ